MHDGCSSLAVSAGVGGRCIAVANQAQDELSRIGFDEIHYASPKFLERAMYQRAE